MKKGMRSNSPRVYSLAVNSERRLECHMRECNISETPDVLPKVANAFNTVQCVLKQLTDQKRGSDNYKIVISITNKPDTKAKCIVSCLNVERLKYTELQFF